MLLAPAALQRLSHPDGGWQPRAAQDKPHRYLSSAPWPLPLSRAALPRAPAASRSQPEYHAAATKVAEVTATCANSVRRRAPLGDERIPLAVVHLHLVDNLLSQRSRLRRSMASNVRIGGSPLALGPLPKITTIFQRGWAVDYDWVADRAVALLQPNPLSTLNFPPGFHSDLEGALRGQGKYSDFTYFFRNGQYQKVQHATMAPDGQSQTTAG